MVTKMCVISQLSTLAKKRHRRKHIEQSRKKEHREEEREIE